MDVDRIYNQKVHKVGYFFKNFFFTFKRFHKNMRSFTNFRIVYSKIFFHHILSNFYPERRMQKNDPKLSFKKLIF